MTWKGWPVGTKWPQRTLRSQQSGRRCPGYKSWEGAKQRCYNPNAKKYEIYGAIGVTMCDRWRTSFANFLADMGPRPPGHSLDRYPDPYGNYEPGNCRWATIKEQRANRSTPHG